MVADSLVDKLNVKNVENHASINVDLISYSLVSTSDHICYSSGKLSLEYFLSDALIINMQIISFQSVCEHRQCYFRTWILPQTPARISFSLHAETSTANIPGLIRKFHTIGMRL